MYFLTILHILFNDLKHIQNKIIKVAVPAIIGYFGLTISEIINIFWIGQLNAKAVAAIAAVAFLQWIIISLMNITTVGCSTLVAQSYGAKDLNKAHKVISEATFFSLILSFLYMLILALTLDSLLTLMGLDTQTKQYTLEYFSIYLFIFPIMYCFHLCGFIFNAYQDTKTSNLILLGVLVTNCILDPLLIFGIFPFPKLQIQGAALATSISLSIGLMMRIWYLYKKSYIPKYSQIFKLHNIYPKYIYTIIYIGVPVALTNFTWSTVFPLLTVLITKFGMEPLAAINIGHRIEGFPYFISMGISIAVTAIIAEHIGAKRFNDVIKTLINGIILVTIILLPISIILILWSNNLIYVLNSNKSIIWYGGEYLKIIGYFEIFLGWELICEGAFNGIGKTIPNMIIRIPLTLIRIPLAYFLAFNCALGIQGIWWAITLSTLLKGIISFILFLYIYKAQLQSIT